MPSLPQGPTDRRFNAQPSAELPDEYAGTVPAPSTPPPLPLIRRKTQAEVTRAGSPPWQSAAPVTAPWPTPPSSRAPNVESAEASTPFASAVDVFDDDTRATDTPDPDPDFRAATNPWWRRIKAPSRQLRMGALIAVLAAAVGWSAGAKPWASHRTANKVLAAKAGGNQASKRGAVAHGAQASAHANRRVAINAKSKPAAAAPAHAKATAKPIVALKPAASTKQLANTAPRAAAKTTANKTTAKAKAKATTPSKKSVVASKAKSEAAKPKAQPAN